MVSFDFEGIQGGKGCNGLFLGPYDENGDEDKEEYFHQPEKKRRLSAEQLQLLEKSFEEENKLEHERKIQLAKELGLQPRQVAIWFQNRRARWKTKQLEMDYDTLQASYNNLKANYDNLLREKDNLQAEVNHCPFNFFNSMTVHSYIIHNFICMFVNWIWLLHFKDYVSV